MAARSTTSIRVASHAELKQKGVIVVPGAHRRIAVFADGDAVYAVENNCPHMGFPLDRGSVRDGMLTCHWHQARFDLRSGCTFDLWADDVPRYESWIDDGVVYVAQRTERRYSTPRIIARGCSAAWNRTSAWCRRRAFSRCCRTTRRSLASCAARSTSHRPTSPKSPRG